MSYSLCQGWILPPVFESNAFKCPLHACSVTQSYLIICEPMNCSPSDSSVHGILQARILKLVAFSYFRGSSRPSSWTRFPRLLHCTWILFREATVEALYVLPKSIPCVQGSAKPLNRASESFQAYAQLSLQEYIIFLPSQVGRKESPDLKTPCVPDCGSGNQQYS